MSSINHNQVAIEAPPIQNNDFSSLTKFKMRDRLGIKQEINE